MCFLSQISEIVMSISWINEPIPGMFVLCWMHFSWWFQIWHEIPKFWHFLQNVLNLWLHSPAAWKAIRSHFYHFFIILKVCAHRYKRSTAAFVGGLGKCFVLNKDLSIYDTLGKDWTPCGDRADKSQKKKWYGLCQAGTGFYMVPVS